MIKNKKIKRIRDEYDQFYLKLGLDNDVEYLLKIAESADRICHAIGENGVAAKALREEYYDLYTALNEQEQP